MLRNNKDISRKGAKKQSGKGFLVHKSILQKRSDGFYRRWQRLCTYCSMDMLEITGLAAGVLTAGSMIPQVIKSWKEKKAEDVSLVMLIVLLAGIVLWIYYGIRKNDLPIIATNSFSLLVNITMTVLRIKFKDNKKGAEESPRLSVTP